MLDIFQQVGQWYPNATNKDLNAGKRLRKEKGEAYKNYFQAYDVDENICNIFHFALINPSDQCTDSKSIGTSLRSLTRRLWNWQSCREFSPSCNRRPIETPSVATFTEYRQSQKISCILRHLIGGRTNNHP